MESTETLFNDCTRSATDRGYLFALTFDEYCQFINGNCFYCDFKEDGKRNGIDRIDNTIGYEINNCVSCCWKCNWMKSDLSMVEFVDWLENIAKNHKNWKLSP